MKKNKELFLKMGSKSFNIEWILSKKIQAILCYIILSSFWLFFFNDEIQFLFKNKEYEKIVLTTPMLHHNKKNNKKLFFHINGYHVFCDFRNETGDTLCDSTNNLNFIKKLEKAEMMLVSYKGQPELKKKVILTRLYYLDYADIHHDFIVSKSSILDTKSYFDNYNYMLFYFLISSYLGLLLYFIQDWIKFCFNFLKRK